MTDEDKKDLADNVEPSILLSLLDSNYRVSEFTYKLGLVREFIISLSVFITFMSGTFLLTYAVVLTLTGNFIMS